MDDLNKNLRFKVKFIKMWKWMMMRKVMILLTKVGATTSGVFLVAYVLAMEMVGPQYRSHL